MKIAIRDDYQNVAQDLANGASLDAGTTVFSKPFTGPDEVVSNLSGYDVVVAMHEQTPFPAEVLEQLPDLRLLVSTGPVKRRLKAHDAERAEAM